MQRKGLVDYVYPAKGYVWTISAALTLALTL